MLNKELLDFLLPYFLVEGFPSYFYGPGCLEVKVIAAEVKFREIEVFLPWKKDDFINPFERIDKNLKTRVSNNLRVMWINLLARRFSESRFCFKGNEDNSGVVKFNDKKELQDILDTLSNQYFYCRYPKGNHQIQFDVVGDIIIAKTIYKKFSSYGCFYSPPKR